MAYENRKLKHKYKGAARKGNRARALVLCPKVPIRPSKWLENTDV